MKGIVPRRHDANHVNPPVLSTGVFGSVSVASVPSVVPNTVLSVIRAYVVLSELSGNGFQLLRVSSKECRTASGRPTIPVPNPCLTLFI